MDIQRTMEFILEQQAATAVNIQQLSAEIKELREGITELRQGVVGLKEIARQHDDELQAHTEWKIGMSQALQDLAGQMRDGFTELAEAQKTTEENLNILIRTVQDILPRIPRQ